MEGMSGERGRGGSAPLHVVHPGWRRDAWTQGSHVAPIVERRCLGDEACAAATGCLWSSARDLGTTPRLACLVPPRRTPLREGLACVALYPRGALGLVDGELVVLM